MPRAAFPLGARVRDRRDDATGIVVELGQHKVLVQFASGRFWTRESDLQLVREAVEAGK